MFCVLSGVVWGGSGVVEEFFGECGIWYLLYCFDVEVCFYGGELCCEVLFLLGD